MVPAEGGAGSAQHDPEVGAWARLVRGWRNRILPLPSIWAFPVPLMNDLSPCDAPPGLWPGLETALALRALNTGERNGFGLAGDWWRWALFTLQ